MPILSSLSTLPLRSLRLGGSFSLQLANLEKRSLYNNLKIQLALALSPDDSATAANLSAAA